MTRRLESKRKMLELLRDWRDDEKITLKDFQEARKIIGAYSPRKGKTYDEIYGSKRAEELRANARKSFKRVSEFERAKTLSIIRVLFTKPRCIRNIRDEVGGSYATIIKRVNFLEKEGYLTTRIGSKHPHRRTARLTERGEQFARAYVSATRKLPDEI